MGQTRVDPVDYARMIVRSCLAREVRETINVGAKSDRTTPLRDFDRYRDSFQVGWRIEQWPRPFGGEDSNAKPCAARNVAAMVVAILSFIAVLTWLVPWFISTQ